MTTIKWWAIGAPALFVALAGCEASSDDEEEPGDRPSYEELVEEGSALFAEIEGTEYTDPSSLPTEGSATYEGVIGIETYGSSGAPEGMLGELTIDMEWDSDEPLSGEATNFVSEGGEELTGSLGLGDGGIDRDVDPDGGGWTFLGEMEGTLTDEDDTDFDLSGQILGDFYGEDPDHARGVTDGIITSEDGNGTFEGDFIAERE